MDTYQKPEKKKSIIKKILIGIAALFGALFLIGILGMIFFPIDYYSKGVDAYNKRDYIKAFENLNLVEQDNKNYSDAILKIQEIKPIVDSIEKVMQLEKHKEDKQSKSTAEAKLDERVASTAESSNSGEMDLKTKIENNIKSIDGGDDLVTKPMTSVQEFTITVALFKSFVITINEGKQSKDVEVLGLTEQLSKKASASQQKNFPKLRKAYFNFIKEKLWENDIIVDLAGKNNTILKFSGGYFAANRNIKSTQEALSEMLHLLRFKQTQYTWYRGQDEYTYYTIESSKDNDLEE